MIDTTIRSTPDSEKFGALSRRYEVGNRGPGTVSGGIGDPGGVSYGSYQLASRLGNARRFLKAEGQPWLNEFGTAEEGSMPFSLIWRRIGQREPKAFHAAQHAFIRRTHFEPQLELIRNLMGMDLARHSRALLDVVWSVAVQHGPGSRIIARSIATLDAADPDFDHKAIKAIYAERARVGPDGKLAWFARSSTAVQQGVARRFRDEQRDALSMLAAERA